MEHSALHAFELIGQIIALGGVFFIWGILRPAARRLEPRGIDLGRKLEAGAERWISYGLLMAATATLLNLFVEIAEVEGKTVFGGVNFHLLAQFVTKTTVGRLEMARAVVLLLTAGMVSGDMRSSRFTPIQKARWSLVGFGILTSIFLTSLVSHSAAQPAHRLLTVSAQMAHLIAAALWIGVLIHLLADRHSFE